MLHLAVCETPRTGGAGMIRNGVQSWGRWRSCTRPRRNSICVCIQRAEEEGCGNSIARPGGLRDEAKAAERWEGARKREPKRGPAQEEIRGHGPQSGNRREELYPIPWRMSSMFMDKDILPGNSLTGVRGKGLGLEANVLEFERAVKYKHARPPLRGCGPSAARSGRRRG